MNFPSNDILYECVFVHIGFDKNVQTSHHYELVLVVQVVSRFLFVHTAVVWFVVRPFASWLRLFTSRPISAFGDATTV